MNQSFIRRIVVVAAIAVATSVFSTPASAAAASLPPDQTAVHSGPTRVEVAPPDLAVYPVGTRINSNGSVDYQFKIKNIGIGIASGIVFTKQATVYHWYDGTVKDDNLTTVSTSVPLNPGQYFVTEVHCPHVQWSTYCIDGNLSVKVTKGGQDPNNLNNFNYISVNTKDLFS